MSRVRSRIQLLLALLAVWVPPAHAAFVTFESGQVRPLALSPDGARLYAVNTPDDRLEIFAVDGSTGALTPVGSVPVGLEPVAVAPRSNGEVWVVNHLSDSVSVVDVVTNPPRVTRTLLVGDEPRDIVFAGSSGTRAFITCAHRGQSRPGSPQLTTEGIGRADVWVFDATSLGTSVGGTPLSILTLFADTPRALAASPDGGTVYAAAFHSGNQTTSLSEALVCNGGASAGPCNVSGNLMPGGLPAPNANFQAITGPETGLIVKRNPANSRWEDRLGRNWTPAVKFNLPDLDVFAIDANNLAAPPTSFAGVGTIVFNLAVNPVSGKVYATNTEARNEVRFEGPGVVAGSTVRGHLHEARITVLDGASVVPRHLNKHIDYDAVPSPAGTKEKSLATPVGMAITSDGATLYVAAFGSSKVGIFDTAALENDTFTPSTADHVTVTGGGPSGLVLNEGADRLYVFTRFDNAISVINTITRQEIAHLAVHNPEPASVVAGRPVLYDALLSSSNGEAACAACHVFGDFDSLAWDLGNPDDVVLANPNPFRVGGGASFHPMKGPMTTQSLRGMANHGPMHWRGDRTGGNDPGGDALDEDAAFKKFIAAFDGLLGRNGAISNASMQAFTDFVLQVTYPPNPIRTLDNSLTPIEQDGRDLYFDPITDLVATCNGCHTLDPSNGFFGGDGFMSIEGETQEFKIPHLRNAYQKIGMFGLPATPGLGSGPTTHLGDQVRGVGFLHDGSIDTLFRFHGATVFSLNDTEQLQLEAFMLAFDSDLAPIVGQQITLTAGNGATVGSRIGLLIARAAAGECELVAKGTLGGEQRGWLRQTGGLFRSDRGTEPLLTDAQLRAQASTATQERTYTCVPPGSGQRVGVDRDEDGFFDRDELDAGSDPADASSIPSGGTTTTITPTTSTTLPVSILAKSFQLRDDSTPPANPGKRKIRFRSNTRRAAPAFKIVAPTPGGPDDPRLAGGTLVVYNAAGVTPDVVNIALPSGNWSLNGGKYRYRDATPGAAIGKVEVKADSISIKGGGASFGYTLDEPFQARVAVRLTLGGVTWCASPAAPKVDKVDRFVAPGPEPVACPPLP